MFCVENIKIFTKLCLKHFLKILLDSKRKYHLNETQENNTKKRDYRTRSGSKLLLISGLHRERHDNWTRQGDAVVSSVKLQLAGQVRLGPQAVVDAQLGRLGQAAVHRARAGQAAALLALLAHVAASPFVGGRRVDPVAAGREIRRETGRIGHHRFEGTAWLAHGKGWRECVS